MVYGPAVIGHTEDGKEPLTLPNEVFDRISQVTPEGFAFDGTFYPFKTGIDMQNSTTYSLVPDESNVFDAFSNFIRVDDPVVYAGKDHKDRITLNKGVVDMVKPDKVRVLRTWSSCTDGADFTQRRVWVELRKVAKVYQLNQAVSDVDSYAAGAAAEWERIAKSFENLSEYWKDVPTENLAQQWQVFCERENALRVAKAIREGVL